ncbi:hypothetical protein [Microbacterium flavum]|uniref:Uncharacterized protein n=1 Tax=Microbacterium flavum TaxID=415216 RepID=A0ABS5XUA4_9MICO|nr:hypothetical protein [Microbacterium flavum]MBT8798118.1 hypothetical protein [Microbacterium flavum]
MTAVVTAGEQTALYVTSIIILLGTLTAFVVQYVRSRRRGGGGRGPDAGAGDS